MDNPINMNLRDLHAVDEMLSKELSELSFADRNAMNEEIHGARCLAPEETPELLDRTIAILGHELAKMRRPQRKYHNAYNKACSHFPKSYIHTRDFQLRFLRYELMNPALAAQRIVKFLDYALELFGNQILERPIQMVDLGNDGLEMMRLGHYQCLPFRDRSGRRVLSFVRDFGLQFPVKTRMKILYYLTWVMTDDVETQRKGLVGVFWWPNSSGITPTKKPCCDLDSDGNSSASSLAHHHNNIFSYIPGPRDHIVGSRFFAGAPGRVVAIHICFPDHPTFHIYRSSLALSINQSRARIKIHSCEGLYLQYTLHSYGIPVDLLPITETGNVKIKNHHRFIKVRNIIEHEQTEGEKNISRDDIIECPGLHDVVFRVGDSYLCHPGNDKFRGWVESTFDEYDAGGKDRKVAITWMLVDEVLKTGRFLVWDKQWWTVLHDREKMRAKVTNAFKDQKRRLKVSANIQTNECSTYKFSKEHLRKRERDETSCLSVFHSS